MTRVCSPRVTHPSTLDAPLARAKSPCTASERHSRSSDRQQQRSPFPRGGGWAGCPRRQGFAAPRPTRQSRGCPGAPLTAAGSRPKTISYEGKGSYGIPLPPVLDPVPRLGHSNRAQVGHSCPAPRVEPALRDFDPLWEHMSTWEKEKFIRTLVEQVRYDGKTGTVTLGFRSSGVRNLCLWTLPANEKGHAELQHR